MEGDVLLSEVERGCKAEGEVCVDAQLAKHADGEAGTVGVCLGVPLFACFGVDITVVAEFEVLHVGAYEEAVMEAALVDVGPVLYLPFLRNDAACNHNEAQEEKGCPLHFVDLNIE